MVERGTCVGAGITDLVPGTGYPSSIRVQRAARWFSCWAVSRTSLLVVAETTSLDLAGSKESQGMLSTEGPAGVPVRLIDHS
jgi:hypothetical protein